MQDIHNMPFFDSAEVEQVRKSWLDFIYEQPSRKQKKIVGFMLPAARIERLMLPAAGIEEGRMLPAARIKKSSATVSARAVEVG